MKKIVLALAMVTVAACGVANNDDSSSAKDIPDGAQGLPVPAEHSSELLSLDGLAAKAVYEAMTVEGEFDGAYHTFKKASGELSCYQRVPWGGSISYGCNLEGTLALEGQAARKVYEAFDVEGEHDGAYHTFKKAKGNLTCALRTPWGAPSSWFCSMVRLTADQGGIPDGAQGLPVPADQGGIPDGAQGLPVPAEQGSGIPEGAQGLPVRN